MSRYQALALLPNTAGFRFIGLRNDGTEAVCMVKRGPDGNHFISGETWANLRSWRTM